LSKFAQSTSKLKYYCQTQNQSKQNQQEINRSNWHNFKIKHVNQKAIYYWLKQTPLSHCQLIVVCVCTKHCLHHVLAKINQNLQRQPTPVHSQPPYMWLLLPANVWKEKAHCAQSHTPIPQHSACGIVHAVYSQAYSAHTAASDIVKR